jgi:thiol-disulfide isomerase/thioredoxin
MTHRDWRIAARRARSAAVALALGLVWVGLTVGAAGSQALRVGQAAPEITGGPWFNSEPLSLAGLRGRVVLVEFWTYGCVNCRNVIPHVRAWHERYGATGLTVVGVHSPEFTWERSAERVREATRRLGVAYPVVQDNDHAIWERFTIRAWPTVVLVDRRGVVRHQHIGEGEYEATEAVIRRLLAETP